MSPQRISVRRFPVFRLLFLALLAWAPAASAFGEPLIVDADQQFQFAERLFTEEKYFRAIGEYERFLFFFPEDDRVPTARRRIGMAYFSGEKYREAVAAFLDLIDDAPEETALTIDDQVTQAYFRISEAYMKMNAPGQAAANLRNLILLADDGAVRDEAYYRSGWIFLESGAWNRAAAFFDQIREENRDRYRLKTLSEELKRIDEIPQKNPTLAGILSIAPGAGYLYGERYRDAFTAFLLNGGLMASAYYAFDNGNPALGAVISFVELGFYAGQFYGAVGSIHKYNQDQTRRFIENLKQTARVSLSAGPRSDGVALSLQLAF